MPNAKPQQPLRVLGYARVSSVEQAIGTSLQDQQNVITAYTKNRGLTVHQMYVEAESAVHERAERRDQVRALMSGIRERDLVLVDKIDRWSRDPEFTYGSIRKILAAGASFYAIGDDCDPSTAAGDSALGFRILFAREEHKRIRQRMVGTRYLLKDKGYYPEGLLPLGYVRQDVKGAEKNALIIDEAGAEIVRSVFRLCIEGRSLRQISDDLQVSSNKVHCTLRNRVYLGEVRNSHGEWIRGRHVPIIDVEMFARAAESLKRRQLGRRLPRAGSETSTWWLRDLTVCALCGTKMSSAYGVRANGTRPYYYRCGAQCNARYVNVRSLEESCETIVIARLTELQHRLSTAKADMPPTARVVDPAQRQARLAQKRERYVEMYADGVLTRETLRKHLDALQGEQTAIDALRLVTPTVTPAQRRAALQGVGQMRRAFMAADPTERRKIVNAIAASVAIAVDREPAFVWLPVEDLVRPA